MIAAMVAISAALALAWLAMTFIFERHIERRVVDELTRTALRLTAGLTIDPAGQPTLDTPLPDPRLATPASGLYWQVSTPKGALRSRSLWDQALPSPGGAQAGTWSHRLAAGPFGQRLLLIERTVQPSEDGPHVLVQLAQDAADLNAARAEFGVELGLFLALLWAALTAAAWAQVRLGLQPLARVRDELAALENNPAERLGSGHPTEIQPLIEAINALADAREKDLARAKRRAADLAHGLKTPLAALSAQSRRAREAGADEAADGLDRAISAASAAIDAELVRSRLSSIRQAEGSPRTIVERLIGVIERTEAGAALAIQVDIADTMRVPAGDDELAELLGPLLENAVRYARRRLRITGMSAADAVSVWIEDDGPGISADHSAQALSRGGRLDEVGSGYGLGLSIARDIAEATGGVIVLERSQLGGLKAGVEWPAA
jgi:signal transduction histidine kinase